MEDSPLAAELLEGNNLPISLMDRLLLTIMAGEGRGSPPASPTASPTPAADPQSFAPRGPSTLHSRIRDKLPRPLRVRVGRPGSIAHLHDACSVRSLDALVLSSFLMARLLMLGLESGELNTRKSRQPTVPRTIPIRGRCLTATRRLGRSPHDQPFSVYR